MDKFIAALDQSGSGIDYTLSSYEVDYVDRQKVIDEFKLRVIRSKCFNTDKIFGVIISEDMLDKEVIKYLKEKKFKIFVKVDRGLLDGENVKKSLLEGTIDKLIDKKVFGTKMRTLILKDDRENIEKLISQQFSFARKIYTKGLIPIIEPEISIDLENKEKCEEILKAALIKNMNIDIKFILKLTLPEKDNFYHDLLNYPCVLKLSFLSGGYSKQKAIKKLSKNDGIACFSRALLEGLKYNSNQKEFEYILSKNIDEIYRKEEI